MLSLLLPVLGWGKEVFGFSLGEALDFSVWVVRFDWDGRDYVQTFEGSFYFLRNIEGRGLDFSPFCVIIFELACSISMAVLYFCMKINQ